MAQGVLLYKYEEERNHAGMTALAGLPIYLDLASGLGVADCIRTHVHVTKSGQEWTDEQAVLVSWPLSNKHLARYPKIYHFLEHAWKHLKGTLSAIDVLF